MRVGIIGVGGVGMAHVIASHNNGYQIAYIVDNDEAVLNKAQKKWENKWSDVYEWAEIQFGVIYANKIPKGAEVDLIIIATPPKTHEDILEQVPTDFEGRILLEKPTFLSEDWSRFNIEVCTEWIHHSKIALKTNLNQLEMHYRTDDKYWKKQMPLAYDFCPHLFSVLIFHGYEILDMEALNCSADNFDIDVFTNRGIVNLTGSRESDWGLGINGMRCKWENDLFEKVQKVGGISLKDYEIWETKLYSLLES